MSAKNTTTKRVDLFQGVATTQAIAEKQIIAIGKDYASFERRLTIVAASVAVVATRYGQCTPCTKLMLALGHVNKGKNANVIRSNELGKWLEEVAPVKWSSKEHSFKMDKARAASMKAEYEANPEAFVDNLIKTPFHKVHQQAAFEGFDFMKQARALLAKAAKVTEDDEKMNHPKTNLFGIKEFEAFVVSLSSKEIAAHPQVH